MSRIDEALRQRQSGPRPKETRRPPDDVLDRFERVSTEAFEEVEDPVLAVEEPIHSSDASYADKLVVDDTTGPVCVEQYRRLAGLLLRLQAERGLKFLMVISAQPGDGKTLTAANLSMTLSESYRRSVLLVDTDLRRPSLARLFGVESETGLSDTLREPSAALPPVIALSDRLSLLPGGTPDSDPMSSLTSDRIRSVIEELSAEVDWVVLDTPPVALLPDAHLLSSLVEAAILVISAGITPYAAVEQTIETIGREKILGVLLNRVEQNQFIESGYYKGYGYGRGYGFGGKGSRRSEPS